MAQRDLKNVRKAKRGKKIRINSDGSKQKKSQICYQISITKKRQEERKVKRARQKRDQKLKRIG